MTILVEQPPASRRRTGLLELRGLRVEYGYDERPARAVDGVDLVVQQGEVLGLAGESGCGKTTIANAVMQILRPPARIAGGSSIGRESRWLSGICSKSSSISSTPIASSISSTTPGGEIAMYGWASPGFMRVANAFPPFVRHPPDTRSTTDRCGATRTFR